MQRKLHIMRQRKAQSVTDFYEEFLSRTTMLQMIKEYPVEEELASLFTAKLSEEVRQEVDAEAEMFGSLAEAYMVALHKEGYINRKKGRGRTGELYEVEDEIYGVDDVRWPAHMTEEQKEAVSSKAQELEVAC